MSTFVNNNHITSSSSSASQSHSTSSGTTTSLGAALQVIDHASKQAGKTPLPSLVTREICQKHLELELFAGDPNHVAKIARIFQAEWEDTEPCSAFRHQLLRAVRHALPKEAFKELTSLLLSAFNAGDGIGDLFNALLDRNLLNAEILKAFLKIYGADSIDQKLRSRLCNQAFRLGDEALLNVVRTLYKTEQEFKAAVRSTTGVYYGVQDGRGKGLDLMRKQLKESEFRDYMRRNVNGAGLLARAVFSGDAELVRKVWRLLPANHKGSMARPIGRNENPLITAVHSASPAAVRAVINCFKELGSAKVSELFTSAGYHMEDEDRNLRRAGWRTKCWVLLEAARGKSEEVLLEVLKQVKILSEDPKIDAPSLKEKLFSPSKEGDPLCLAVEAGHFKALDLMRELAPDNFQLADRLWHRAIASGRVDCLRKVHEMMGKRGLDYRSSHRCLAFEKLTLLHSAARNGNVEVLKDFVRILEKEEQLITLSERERRLMSMAGSFPRESLLHPNAGRERLMHYAASSGSKDCLLFVVDLLKRHDAEHFEEFLSRFVDSDCRHSLLSCACMTPSVEVVETVCDLLRKHGVTVELGGELAWSPLREALNLGNPEFVAYLAKRFKGKQLDGAVASLIKHYNRKRVFESPKEKHDYIRSLLELVPHLSHQHKAQLLSLSLFIAMDKDDDYSCVELIGKTLAKQPADVICKALGGPSFKENYLGKVLHCGLRPAYALYSLLHKLSSQQRHELLTYKDITICLHMALTEVGDEDLVRLLSHLLPPDDLGRAVLSKPSRISFLHWCIDEMSEADEVFPVLLKRLGKEDLVKALKLRNREGESLLHRAAFREYGVEAIVSYCSRDQVDELMQADKKGRTPFHTAVDATDGLIIYDDPATGLKTLLAALTKEHRRYLTQRDKEGATPLHIAASRRSSEPALAVLLEELTQEELRLSMKPDQKGNTPIHYLLSQGNLKGLNLLLAKLDKKTLYAAVQPNKEGKTPLHLVKRGSNCLLVLFGALDESTRTLCMLPDVNGTTPLHTAALRSFDEFRTCAALVLQMKGKALEAATQPNKNGRNLFHHAAIKQSPMGLDLCQKIFEEAGRSLQVVLNEKDRSGKMPLSRLVRNQEPESVLHLAKLYSPEDLKAIMLSEASPLRLALETHNRAAVARLQEIFFRLLDETSQCEVLKQYSDTGDPLLFKLLKLEAGHAFDDFAARLMNLSPRVRQFALESAVNLLSWVTHTERLGTILQLLQGLPREFRLKVADDLGIAFVLGSKYNIRCEALQLLHQMLTPDELGRILRSERDQQIFFHRYARWVLGGSSQSWLPLLKKVYPKLSAALEKQRNHLLRQIDATAVVEQREQLLKDLEVLLGEQLKLFSVVVASSPDERKVESLIPLLQRISVYPDQAIGEGLVELLKRSPFTPSPSSDRVAAWAKDVGAKHPGLYLFALKALLDRGIDPQIITALHRRVQSMKAKFNEGNVNGKLFLKSCIILAGSKTLETADIQRLLLLMLHGDTLKIGASISQIHGMGMTKRLCSQALKATIPNFENLALRCFRSLVPVSEVDDFAARYDKEIASQRKPKSIITYASGLRGEAEVLKLLASCLDAVFAGTFADFRYSSKNNPHLAALYAKSPQLEAKLKALVGEVPTFSLAEFAEKKVKVKFPSDRKSLTQRIVNDKHLSEERFPFIHRYLSGDKTASHDLGELLKKDRNNRDLLLQRRLISICSQSDALEKTKNDPQKARSLENGRAKDLAAAHRLANELKNEEKKPIGEFHQDLISDWDKYQLGAPKEIDTLEVSITDAFWDLLRIGSDMGGSCQRVDGSPSLNKCLMDYISNGKNIPIVIRRPGDDLIIARRMLRLEILESTGEPALYLECFYGSYDTPQAQKGMDAMAIAVAKKLGIPLYTAGYQSDVTLVSKGSSAPFAYSDSGGGVTNGYYTVKQTRLLYSPSSSSSSSSSSH